LPAGPLFENSGWWRSPLRLPKNHLAGIHLPARRDVLGEQGRINASAAGVDSANAN
jgi:hypothetical protein